MKYTLQFEKLNMGEAGASHILLEIISKDLFVDEEEEEGWQWPAMASEIDRISASSPLSYACSPFSLLWPVIFMISEPGTFAYLSFFTGVFLVEWLVSFFPQVAKGEFSFIRFMNEEV